MKRLFPQIFFIFFIISSIIFFTISRGGSSSLWAQGTRSGSSSGLSKSLTPPLTPEKKIVKKQYELELNSGVSIYMSEYLNSASASFTNQVIFLKQFYHNFKGGQRTVLSYGGHLLHNYISNDAATIQVFLGGAVFSAFYHNNDFAHFFSFLRGYSGFSLNFFQTDIEALKPQNGLATYFAAQYGFGYMLSPTWHLTLGHRFFVHAFIDGAYWSQDILLGVNYKW